MSRKNTRGGQPPSFESERTLAAAEQDVGGDSAQAPSRCACGSDTLVLQAFLQVVDGVPDPRPVEVESLTCPDCGREFEAILTDDGRVLRGDFLGFFEEDASE
jgi:hypothetical protein